MNIDPKAVWALVAVLGLMTVALVVIFVKLAGLSRTLRLAGRMKWITGTRKNGQPFRWFSPDSGHSWYVVQPDKHDEVAITGRVSLADVEDALTTGADLDETDVVWLRRLLKQLQPSASPVPIATKAGV